MQVLRVAPLPVRQGLPHLRELLLWLQQVRPQAQVVRQVRAGGLVTLQVLRAVVRVAQRGRVQVPQAVVRVVQQLRLAQRVQVLLPAQGPVEGLPVLQVRPRVVQ